MKEKEKRKKIHSGVLLFIFFHNLHVSCIYALASYYFISGVGL